MASIDSRHGYIRESVSFHLSSVLVSFFVKLCVCHGKMVTVAPTCLVTSVERSTSNKSPREEAWGPGLGHSEAV